MNIKTIFHYDDTTLDDAYLPDVCVPTKKIRMLMINEIAPPIQQDDFYASPKSLYATCVTSLFNTAGIKETTPLALLDQGIYITNAVKTPKQSTTIEKDTILLHSYLLEQEIQALPNLNIIMAMGDVAKKALNLIAKRQGLKPVFPSGSTYKQRKDTFTFHDIIVMPAYIMTGENIRIEKSKFAMNVEDIAKAYQMLQDVSSNNI